MALYAIGKLPRPITVETGGRSMLSLAADVPVAVLALLRAPAEREWGFVDPGSQEFGAWKEFALAHTGKVVTPQTYNTDAKYQIGVDDKPVFVGYETRVGLKVPAPFPPRVDGSWPEIPEADPISKTG
jgi:hypothetical protein